MLCSSCLSSYADTVGVQLIATLEHIHKLRIVHRDLSTSNIYVTRTYRPWVRSL
jgi:serine/threonine protein kinase